jgi:hypothetical protein
MPDDGPGPAPSSAGGAPGLGFGLQRRLGPANPRQALLVVRQPRRHLVAALVAKLAILRRVDLRRLLQPALDLRPQLGLAPLHAPVAHRLVLGGVGLHLAVVQRHMAERDQPRLATQRQHLPEKARQHRQMALAEVADGAKVRPLQRRHRHEVQPPLAARAICREE